MGLDRDIYEFWKSRHSRGAGWFRPEAAEDLREDPESLGLLSRLEVRLGEGATESVLRSLRILDIMSAEVNPRLVDVEFVATLPAGFAINARPTVQAVAEMIDSSSREVIAFGYEINDRGVISRLVKAAARAVEVTLICDREREVKRTVMENWPDSVPPPAIYQNRKRDGEGPFASMHSKSLVVDGRDLLQTSANLTFHGLNENLEFGIRLQGAVAAESRRLFREILDSGVLERVV